MSRETELHEQIGRLRRELGEIETGKKRKAALSLYGKCFRYRNCYSMPEGEKDYWWTWARVIGVSDAGAPISFEFQTDKNGRFECQTEEHYSGLSGGWSPTTFAEYRAAWETAMRHVAEQTAGPLSDSVSAPSK